MSKDTPRPKGVLLDIGGTVLRANSFDFVAGIRALSPRRDGDLLFAELKAAVDVVHSTNSAEFTIAEWLAENRDCFGREGAISELELIVWRETFQPTPMPGVREALQLLYAYGLIVGCISNTVFSGPVLYKELQHHQLADSVRFLISSADVAIRKPAPEIFLTGVSNLRLKPSEVWFVGDTWAADIEGATEAGLFPVWLSHTRESTRPHVPHAHAASWREVSRLVTAALA
ncbi:MAG: HAD family hydrolase [Gammaproteobacteria bacterium]